MGQAVKGADPHGAGRRVEHLLETHPHLACRLVGEGNGEDVPARNLLDLDQPRDPVNQYTRFARAGASKDELIGLRRSDRFPLGVIQLIEDMGDIHNK